eukprot:SAG31_NODE_24370_length_483_cov_0.669271_1_plen_119_part_10
MLAACKSLPISFNALTLYACTLGAYSFTLCRCAGDNSTCADCRGVPFGSAAMDPNRGRDQCHGVRHPREAQRNSTSGVDGLRLYPDPNCKLPADFCVPDCAGEWGGIKKLDNCSVCGGD